MNQTIMAPNRKKRENLIQEILNTETSYVNDLKSCVDIFLDPSDAHKFESEGVNIGQLFLNIKEIYETSEKLLKLLNKYVKGFDFDQQTVGQCFLEVADDLKNVYSYYCVNIDSANDYKDTVKQCPTIVAKIKEMEEYYQKTNKILNLNSILTTPIQKITKYPLLLENLLNETEVEHMDFKGLQQASDCMKEVVNHVNESKRKNEVVIKYRKTSEFCLRNKITQMNAHSVQKKMTRWKGSLASKTGLIVTFKDEEFDLKLEQFDSVQETVSGLKRNFETYRQQFIMSKTIFNELANNVGELYGDESKNSTFVLGLHELKMSHCSICESVEEQIKTMLLTHLTILNELYKGPQALINKRFEKLMEICGDKTLELTKKEFEALNSQLKVDLPNLCKLSKEIVLDIIVNFILAMNNYRKLWCLELKKFIEFIEMKVEKHQRESNSQHVLRQLSQMRFHQFFDANYPVKILANILLNVPVLSSKTNRYSSLCSQYSYTTKPGGSNIGRTFHSESDALPLSSNSDLKQSLMIEDDGFYFAKMPYYGRVNQPEVSLYDGQFVTVTAKKDGNGNSEWWEVNTGDTVGYCPAICLEKATDFMETGEIPFSEFNIMDTS